MKSEAYIDKRVIETVPRCGARAHELYTRDYKVGELERPLVSDDADLVRNQGNELPRGYDLEGACFPSEGNFRSPRPQGLVHKPRLPTAPPILTQSDSFVLDVISDAPEDILVGQTLKRPLAIQQLLEEQRNSRQSLEQERFQEFLPKDTLNQKVQEPASTWRSYLVLPMDFVVQYSQQVPPGFL
ncbi:hypothetical protein C1H46_016827 [Malus baccata]|uniref:Uncharacterized protein n=1 Tax=Malus baccata TaxID=106549 RepID=A0A540MFP2_MALBA|nr:hypothetical protein C1H46_016827 [Malus baccata]